MIIQLNKNSINFLSSKPIEKSADDWNKFSGSKIPSSLELNPVIYNYISKDDEILDIGMGFGKTVFDLYKEGYTHLSGVDSNASGIQFANNEAKSQHIQPKPSFKVGNAKNLPFNDGSKNAIVTQAFWTTIVNRDDKKVVLSEINRVIKKNGVLYISDFGQTPESSIYKQRYDQGVAKGYDKGTFDVINPKTKELEYVAHHHTKEEFSGLLTKAGFKIEVYKIEPIKTRSGNQINGHVIIARKVRNEF